MRFLSIVSRLVQYSNRTLIIFDNNEIIVFVEALPHHAFMFYLTLQLNKQRKHTI